MKNLLMNLPSRTPNLLGVIGLFFIILFSVMGASSFAEMQKIGDEPQEATLASIVSHLNSKDRYWVIVKDGSFDCQTLHYEKVGSSIHTEIFLENSDMSIAMLVTYTEELSCDAISNSDVSGVAYRMSERHRLLLDADHRLDNYSMQTAFVALCAVCSKSNSEGLFILSIFFVTLGLIPFLLLLWIKKRMIFDSVDEFSER